MTSRRADLDWLRVLAFGLLIAYHAGMAWSGWSWHVVAPDHLDGLRAVMLFTNRWRMPLLFLVSGATIMLALGQRSGGAFVVDRLKRLLVPLVFGMLVIVPPQVYLERRFRSQFDGSFLDWLPHAVEGGAYPAGNVSWHHLWFLAYVLVLTLLLLPVFLWMRSAGGRRAVETAGAVAARYHLHWLAVLPVAASIQWLMPASRNVNGLVGDWHGLVAYGVLLLYGALLYASPALLQALQRRRAVSLAVGIAAFGLLTLLYFRGAVRPEIAAASRPPFALLSAVNMMAWLFAIVGYAQRYLTRRPPFLAAATEAVYPFYILHQTVTVALVYLLLEAGVAPLPGFALAVLGTFAGTWLVYAVCVRPWRLVRPLFGMKDAGPAERGFLPGARPAYKGR